MPSHFRKNKRLLLLFLLLPAFTSAWANDSNPIGDWWIIYGDGAPGKNVTYVADRTSVMPSNKTKGAQLVAITLVYEELVKPMIDVYNIEVQCSTQTVRFINGQSVARMGSLRHLKVSDKWQSAKEPWVQRSVDFVCTPKSKDMLDSLSDR
ncbi:hypothetical protein SB766_07685 [Pseudomonas sp. SIMBA_077]